MNILIVDESSKDAISTAAALEHACKIKCCDNETDIRYYKDVKSVPKKAITDLDLVIVDANGAGVIERIRSLGKRTCVLGVASCAQERERIVKKGANGIIRKPLDIMQAAMIVSNIGSASYSLTL